MQVESEVGKGSTFTVWLPVHPDKRLLRTAVVCSPAFPALMHGAGDPTPVHVFACTYPACARTDGARLRSAS